MIGYYKKDYIDTVMRDDSLASKNGKIILIMGLLIILLGIYLFRIDRLMAVLAILYGCYNIYKGYRITQGYQPYIIRKYQEKERKEQDEIEDQAKKQ